MARASSSPSPPGDPAPTVRHEPADDDVGDPPCWEGRLVDQRDLAAADRLRREEGEAPA